MNRIGCFLVLMVLISTAMASTYRLPDNGDNVVGYDRIESFDPGDSLSSFARRYDVGYYAVLEASPGLDPLSVRSGKRLFVPGQFILPDAPREGIVINLAELRLYYYPPGTNKVVTYPIGIGRVGTGWQTPQGQSPITEKKKDPLWHVPVSVVIDMARRGKILEEYIPPGPENPLGNYMMRLGNTAFLIHGTNRPDSVGRRTSAGCVHLYPEDIKALYKQVPLGTQVTIINQPVKVGILKGQVYFEAHSPLREDRLQYAAGYGPLSRTVLQTIGNHQTAKIDWTQVQFLAQKQTGVPDVVGTL